MRKVFNKCDECGRKMKTFHLYKNKGLCGACYKKQFVIIPSRIMEPIIMTTSFTIALTDPQKKILDERVSFLFPNMKNCRTKYLRALILGDIEFWGSKKEEK